MVTARIPVIGGPHQVVAADCLTGAERAFGHRAHEAATAFRRVEVIFLGHFLDRNFFLLQVIGRQQAAGVDGLSRDEN
jgi:hypothetical protein